MTSSVRAKRAADQKAANRREEEMRLAKLEGRILEAEEIVKQAAPEEPVAETPAPAPRRRKLQLRKHLLKKLPRKKHPLRKK